MGQVITKSSFVECHHHVQDEIRKLTKNLPLRQRSAVLRISNRLAELPASERRAALNIIRQRYENRGLDYPWLTSFLAVLGNLKAEQSHYEAE